MGVHIDKKALGQDNNRGLIQNVLVRKAFAEFQKVGFKIKKNGIRKFAYKNSKTGKLIFDNDGDMVYYEGKDKFITKLLKSDKIVVSDTDFW